VGVQKRAWWVSKQAARRTDKVGVHLPNRLPQYRHCALGRDWHRGTRHAPCSRVMVGVATRWFMRRPWVLVPA